MHRNWPIAPKCPGIERTAVGLRALSRQSGTWPQPGTVLSPGWTDAWQSRTANWAHLLRCIAPPDEPYSPGNLQAGI